MTHSPTLSPADEWIFDANNTNVADEEMWKEMLHIKAVFSQAAC